MNEKTKTTNAATGNVCYRANYQYAAKNGQLRTGSIIIEAPNITEAQKIATDRLGTFGLSHARLTGVKEY